MFRISKFSFVVAVLLLGFGVAAVPLFGEGSQTEDVSWWFPDDLKPSMFYDYHLEYSIEEKRGWRMEDRADFTLSTHREEERPGCIMKLHRVKRPFQTSLAAFLSGFVEEDDPGIRITKDEFFYREGLILRGPFKNGDRFTMAAFFFTFIGYSMSVGHGEVRSVGANEVQLVSDFWLGKFGPEMKGSSRATLTKDDQGLSSVRFNSNWGNGQQKYRLKLSVKRTRIYAKPPATKQPAKSP